MKPVILMIDPRRLKEEIEGVTMQALMDKGYTVASVLVTEEGAPGQELQRLTVILQPPGPATKIEVWPVLVLLGIQIGLQILMLAMG
jgi:hypothetical protein